MACIPLSDCDTDLRLQPASASSAPSASWHLDDTGVPYQRPKSSADSRRNNYALTLGDFVGAADRDPHGRRSRNGSFKQYNPLTNPSSFATCSTWGKRTYSLLKQPVQEAVWGREKAAATGSCIDCREGNQVQHSVTAAAARQVGVATAPVQVRGARERHRAGGGRGEECSH